MNIYNMKSIFLTDFHIRDDQEKKFKKGDLKIRKVIKIKDIDNNWIVIGVLNSRFIRGKTFKFKTVHKIYKNSILVNTHNLLKNNIFIVHKKRLRQKIGEVEKKYIEKIKCYTDNYLKQNKEKYEFIKNIENKNIYTLSFEEQKKWETDKQFDSENREKYFNINKIFLRNNILEEKQKELSSDILDVSNQLIIFTKKAQETIEKINLLNSKKFLEHKDKNLQKLYFEVNDEKEKLKIEVDVYKKQLNLYKLEREDKNEYIKKLKNKLKEIKEINDIYKDKNNKNIKEKEIE